MIGRDVLARFIVNNEYSGGAHDIAAELLTEREELRGYRILADEPGVLLRVRFNYEIVLRALEKLTEAGGEIISVSGYEIAFVREKPEETTR